MITTRWAAGSFEGVPVFAWEWNASFTLLPSQRTVVIDQTGEFDGGGAPDAVNGIVSHLLEMGLQLCRNLDVPPRRGVPTGWVVEFELPGELRIRDPEGQLALETDELDAALTPWLQEVLMHHGCLLYSGSGLLGTDGRISFDTALANATLVCGWAQHRW